MAGPSDINAQHDALERLKSATADYQRAEDAWKEAIAAADKLGVLPKTIAEAAGRSPEEMIEVLRKLG